MAPRFQADLTVEPGFERLRRFFVGSTRRLVSVVPVSNGIGVPSGPGAVTTRPSGRVVVPGLTSNWSNTEAALVGRGQ